MLDGGVLLLAQADRMMWICGRLVGCVPNPRDPDGVVHRLEDILRAGNFAIACGYEGDDNPDSLRGSPGLCLPFGKLPRGGEGLTSQPMMSRWGNAPNARGPATMVRAIPIVFTSACPDADRLRAIVLALKPAPR